MKLRCRCGHSKFRHLNSGKHGYGYDDCEDRCDVTITTEDDSYPCACKRFKETDDD